MTISRRGAWVALVSLAAAAVGVVLVPVFLIRPFAPQTPGTMALAFWLRRWSPAFTFLAAAGGLGLLIRLWRATPRRLARAASLVALLFIAASAWLARQNHFEWMFAPLPDARFVYAVSADFVAPGDMVLAVAVRGDPVAYPIRQLAYHHLVEDAVGTVPIVATY